MDAYTSYGIRATGDDSGYKRPRIILRESNYRVWATVVEQSLREKKLWGHILGTALRPPASRVVTPAVAARAAAPGVDAMAGAVEITQGMVDQETKRYEDFDAAIARANSVLLQTLDPKDVMATLMLPTPAQKWAKLAEDYAAISTSMASNARSRFHEFRMRDGDSVIETQHRFDQMVNECIIQAVAIDEENKTMVLLTHPTEKWRGFMDAYATQSPLPKVDVIFRAMKSLEERWTSRNEREHGEANYAGMRGVNGGYKPKTGGGSTTTLQPWNNGSGICYCCGNTGHFARDCTLRGQACNLCNIKGHMSNMCKKTEHAEEEDSAQKIKEIEESVELPAPPQRPRLVSFAKVPKKEAAKEEGMFLGMEVDAAASPTGVPRGVPKMMPTPGLEEAEGGKQNWERQPGLGWRLESMLSPVGAKVVSQPPDEGAGGGALVAMGVGPPIVVLALPAAHVGTQIDWGGEVSSEDGSIPGLEMEYEPTEEYF